MLQQSATEETADARKNQQSSYSAIPSTALFPPTSKYHQNGLARRRRWLVVDFDDTCTEHDTTPLLPRLAALASRQRSDTGEMNEKEVNDIHRRDLQRRLAQFQQLEDEYMRRLDEAKSSLLSSSGEGGEVSVHDVLDALDKPSNIVTKMVSESRVLEGLGHVDSCELREMLHLHGITSTTATTAAADSLVASEKEVEYKIDVETANDDDAGEDEILNKVVVRIRHGCQSTLARILSENEDKAPSSSSCLGWSVAVLSINWCPALIDASLVQPVLRQRRSILQIDSCETEVPIWSNEMCAEGIVTLHVPGALAKRDRIMELRRHIQSTDVDSPSLIIYVGDSSTDLAALLEADIGIIIGTSSSMAMIAERWDIQIVQLQHRRQHGFGSSLDGGWRKKQLLWQVESWDEIDQLLIELDEHW